MALARLSAVLAGLEVMLNLFVALAALVLALVC
jgi:hypothetical protein